MCEWLKTSNKASGQPLVRGKRGRNKSKHSKLSARFTAGCTAEMQFMETQKYRPENSVDEPGSFVTP